LAQTMLVLPYKASIIHKTAYVPVVTVLSPLCKDHKCKVLYTFNPLLLHGFRDILGFRRKFFGFLRVHRTKKVKNPCGKGSSINDVTNEVIHTWSVKDYNSSKLGHF
jgi:hypothetical protein